MEMKYGSYVLAAFAASTMAAGAWLKFNVGPVPYTLQNFGVVLASLLLGPSKAAASVLLYIAMIAVGLPVGAGFVGGPHHLFGYTAGYIWGFLVSAPLVSALSRLYLRAVRRCAHGLRPVDVVALVALVTLGMLPTYLLGYAVFRYYALSSPGLLGWASAASGLLGVRGDREVMLLTATILVFLPQDLLVDHLLAVTTFSKFCRFLSSRGVVAEGCLCERSIG